MRGISTLGSIALICATITALSITSPAPGASLDPTQPIVVQWTSDSSDPSSIDLLTDKGDSGGLSSQTTLASGLTTSSHSYTVPANTIQTFGKGFLIEARGAGANGNILAQVTDLTLSPFQNAVSTNSDGQYTVVGQASTASTAQGPITAPTTLQSATGVTTLSGTATPVSTGLGTTNTKSTGFITSLTSRSSSESSAAATSTQVANTATAQIQMRGSEVVLGAAGFLAGIVALLA